MNKKNELWNEIVAAQRKNLDSFTKVAKEEIESKTFEKDSIQPKKEIKTKNVLGFIDEEEFLNENPKEKIELEEEIKKIKKNLNKSNEIVKEQAELTFKVQ